jgi:putative transposase
MAIDKKLIDQLLTDYKKPEDIIGENGLLKELTKAILERALEAEMTDHLGWRSTIRRVTTGATRATGKAPRL